MIHLSDVELETLDPGARAQLAQHLATPCEVCEAFLARQEGPGALDGLVDRLLLRDSLRPEPLHEVAFRRVLRALARQRWAEVVLQASWGVAACLAVLAGAQAVQVHRLAQSMPGTKGEVPAVLVELSAASMTPDGGARGVEPGGTLRPVDTLLFRYRASLAGRAALVRLTPAGPERWGTFDIQAGVHDLSFGSRVAGVPLAEYAGQHLELMLVVVPVDGEAPDLEAALSAALSGRRDPRWATVVERFEVRSGP